MMIFGYMIGMVLFAFLYVGGMKIMQYINPEPPHIPDDIEEEFSNISTIHAFGKSYRCIKTVKTNKTYYYDADCNVLEHEWRYTIFHFVTIYTSMTGNGKVTVYEESGEPIECYLSADMKSLISYNPIVSERIFEYRKPWKNKALSV